MIMKLAIPQEFTKIRYASFARTKLNAVGTKMMRMMKYERTYPGNRMLCGGGVLGDYSNSTGVCPGLDHEGGER